MIKSIVQSIALIAITSLDVPAMVHSNSVNELTQHENWRQWQLLDWHGREKYLIGENKYQSARKQQNNRYGEAKDNRSHSINLR